MEFGVGNSIYLFKWLLISFYKYFIRLIWFLNITIWLFLYLQLNLIESINNDVVVSAIISGGHIFVQHPLHPTHPSLAVLQKWVFDSYTATEAPLLPGIELNDVCVMPVNGIWYRVQIVDQDTEETERCVVKFLDFGGYMNVHFKELRQIRSDFMSVPFQATECILSNVEPIGKFIMLWLQ